MINKDSSAITSFRPKRSKRDIERYGSIHDRIAALVDFLIDELDCDPEIVAKNLEMRAVLLRN
jgi:hypothetical protein